MAIYRSCLLNIYCGYFCYFSLMLKQFHFQFISPLHSTMFLHLYTALSTRTHMHSPFDIFSSFFLGNNYLGIIDRTKYKFSLKLISVNYFERIHNFLRILPWLSFYGNVGTWPIMWLVIGLIIENTSPDGYHVCLVHKIAQDFKTEPDHNPSNAFICPVVSSSHSVQSFLSCVKICL